MASIIKDCVTYGFLPTLTHDGICLQSLQLLQKDHTLQPSPHLWPHLWPNVAERNLSSASFRDSVSFSRFTMLLIFLAAGSVSLTWPPLTKPTKNHGSSTSHQKPQTSSPHQLTPPSTHHPTLIQSNLAPALYGSCNESGRLTPQKGPSWCPNGIISYTFYRCCLRIVDVGAFVLLYPHYCLNRTSYCIST